MSKEVRFIFSVSVNVPNSLLWPPSLSTPFLPILTNGLLGINLRAAEENVGVNLSGLGQLDSGCVCFSLQARSAEVAGDDFALCAMVSFTRRTLFDPASQAAVKACLVQWTIPGMRDGGVNDDSRNKQGKVRSVPIRLRLTLVFLLFAIGVLLLCWRAAYVSLGRDNRDRTNFILMMRAPTSVLKLEEQSSNLQRMSRHIDQYRLVDIVESLKETSRLASNANLELKAQYEAWMNVKERVSSDARAYLEIQKKLAATNQLQAQEIDRLHAVLAQAEKPSFLYSGLSLVFTFVLGVLTSMASDSLKMRLKYFLAFLQKKFQAN